MAQPQVIFLDAVGTLFGVRGSVGQVYQQIAQHFGVEVSVETLNRSFRRSFQAGGLPAFPGVDPTEIPTKEFEWWQAIAVTTFEQAGVLSQFADFGAFFKALFAHFATADPWVLYPDVIPTLTQWRSQGIQLGVLSNFDSRLHSVLRTLDLAQFFSSVTISTEVGAAKPDAQIFQTALQKHDCAPTAAWHIGDSYDEDYQAACTVGLKGFWLTRDDQSVPLRTMAIGDQRSSPASIASLAELLGATGLQSQGG